MIGRARHLHDDRLFDCYLAEQSGAPVDPPAAEHLADCASCRSRYSELMAFLSVVREEADAETDEIFTPERLQRQQQHILQKIAYLNRPARVISFPGLVTRQMAAHSLRIGPRWLAASAAAGLLVGVAMGGMFFDRGPHRSVPSLKAASGQPPVGHPGPQPAVLVSNPTLLTDPLEDGRFLVELDSALMRSHPRELQPFDALTPRVREIDGLLR